MIEKILLVMIILMTDGSIETRVRDYPDAESCLEAKQQYGLLLSQTDGVSDVAARCGRYLFADRRPGRRT